MQSEPLARILSRVESAARQAGRDPATVRLVAVSKQHSIPDIRALAQAGQRDFGESYAQEALPKIAALEDLPLAWHFIGRLQGNKTRPIAEHFDWAHTLDRAKIADRLNAQRPPGLPPLNVCIQVHLSTEDQKGGVAPGEVAALARHISELPRLRLRGLMCIPVPAETFAEQLAIFSGLSDCAQELAASGITTDTLSMGMSGDFEAAIAAGSTLVRIGTALFGARVGHAP